MIDSAAWRLEMSCSELAGDVSACLSVSGLQANLLLPFFGLTFAAGPLQRFSHTQKTLNVFRIQADRALELLESLLNAISFEKKYSVVGVRRRILGRFLNCA